MAVGIVVVGTSLGGLEALKVLLAALPARLPAPVAIVQHRGSDADPLDRVLRAYSAVPVREPDDKEESMPGMAYLAPAGYHLLVDDGSFALSTDVPVCFARPSIDMLFESAAFAYDERVAGVILTGRGRDGAHGLATIKERGGYTIVEDPATAESPGLPKAALAATRVDRVVPIRDIAAALIDVFGRAARS